MEERLHILMKHQTINYTTHGILDSHKEAEKCTIKKPPEPETDSGGI